MGLAYLWMLAVVTKRLIAPGECNETTSSSYRLGPGEVPSPRVSYACSRWSHASRYHDGGTSSSLPMVDRWWEL